MHLELGKDNPESQRSIDNVARYQNSFFGTNSRNC
jgi:hypothetical protein